MSVAKSGWEKVNPCYEEFYEKEIAAGTPSPTGAGWVYPALFRSGDTWLLVSESALSRNYSGTRLQSESPDGEYTVGFPDPRENFQGGPVNPESKLPWLTPWRVVVVGSLKTVAESTLGVDLADKPAARYSEFGDQARQGVLELAAARRSADDLRRAEAFHRLRRRDGLALLPHRCATGTSRSATTKVKELIDYARGKGVGVLLWYNSAGDWNSAPQTPRNLMLTHESRVREFERLKAMGVAGLKIDFFGGDGQSMIGYYHDILEDAAPLWLSA